jgi:lysophospholipase L1-like esterase
MKIIPAMRDLTHNRLAAPRSALTLLMLLAIAQAVAARPSGFSPELIADRPIEDPDGSAMRSFYESLMKTETGDRVTRIIHYGDSHVAADILTGALRRSFQRGFGNAGPGFVLSERPWPWYAPAGVNIITSDGWHASGLSATREGRDRSFGLAGISADTELEGQWVRLTAATSFFDLYLLRQPEGGSIAVLLDGEMIHRRLSLTSKKVEPAYIEIDAGSDELHTVELRTMSEGRVRVLGLVAERDTAGVTYDALGINGARASRPHLWDWSVLSDNLARRDPNLIIIAYGSNEVTDGDLDLAEYSARFAEMLSRFRRAAPRASLLVISPYDRAVRSNGKWQAAARMAALVAAQRRAALKEGVAFWDLFKAMGGEGSINRWAARRAPLAQPDRVHLTAPGYCLVALALYRQLMRGYVCELVGSADCADYRDYRMAGRAPISR